MSALFCFISHTAKVTREIKSFRGRCATEWSACGCYGFDPAWVPGYDFFSLVPNTCPQGLRLSSVIGQFTRAVYVVVERTIKHFFNSLNLSTDLANMQFRRHRNRFNKMTFQVIVFSQSTETICFKNVKRLANA